MTDHLSDAVNWVVHSLMVLPMPGIDHLVWFTSVALGLFLVRLMVRRYRIRMSRSALPLVIGGWGTRGKSGTERKKTALFQALGYNVVSKTTGCEATILLSRPGLDAVEIPIYRPGEKASIWEQEKILQWAAGLKAEVFLWECMALGSDYAALMQHSWMNDDWSTITNTFVDHENVQGPTGIDVSRSIAAFIPMNSKVYTAEENMLPVLKDHARKLNSSLIPLKWSDAELIGSDAINLFPYNVHPRNLGMILNMARDHGIDADFALRETARNIVPDLGSFKKYSVRFQTREIEYWNGMSANDRTSCLSNWNLAGFSMVPNDGRTWIVTVVNNRDDRIIRSREFAETLVNYTPANLHVLIGTNLNGFYGYLQDALEHFARQFFLSRDVIAQLPVDRIRDRFNRFTHRTLEWFRVDGTSPEAIQLKLNRMLEAVNAEYSADGLPARLPDTGFDCLKAAEDYLLEAGLKNDLMRADMARQLFKDMQDLQRIKSWENDYGKLLEKPALSFADVRRLNSRLTEFIKGLFNSGLMVIRDPIVPGDDIIWQLVRRTPPGHILKIMGLQNIKGTGMGFAYRWVSLEKVMRAIRNLADSRLDTRIAAASELATHDAYGMLDIPVALEALKQARMNPDNDTPEMLAPIEEALRKLTQLSSEQADPRRSRMGRIGKAGLRFFEQLLELGDSKRRQRTSRQVMQDLVNGRIAAARAAQVIHGLNKRQEGGWLLSRRVKPPVDPET
ncbi:hypothetical protein JXA40_10910 [bacterium]|nr:hypothetical protein [candidate division CSSED10-310 bacterium]